MAFATVNGVQIYYELNGDAAAPVVVFVNGIFQDTTGWALAVQALGSQFRALVYDCRGQRQSDKPEAGPYTSELHACDLAALLDAVGIAHAHFVGLSNGGVILMHFAKLFGERIDKLVLVDTFAWMDATQQAMLDSWRAALQAGGSALRFTVSLPWTYSAPFLAANKETILNMKARAAQLPTYSSIHLVDGIYHHDARAWLPDVTVPTLIVHGDEDRMAAPASVRAMQALISHSRIHWLAGAGHAAWLEQADAFNQTVVRFLNEEEQ